MKKETTPTDKSDPKPATPEQAARERSLFLGAVLHMSWQLALVVLLPIAGGRVLDDRLHQYPFWTMAGFILAVVAAIVVVWRQAKTVSPSLKSSNDSKEHQQ